MGAVILIDDWQHKISSFFVSKKFHIILISIGIVLRLKHYFENRSFWLDESWVALNILDRSFKGILLSISLFADLPDTRSPGFSLITKLFTVFFGNHEFIFRLFPLLSGILALILFYFLMRRYLNSEAISSGLVLFVFCDSLVYYAAELKQYSSDVLCVISLYLFFEHVRQKKYEFRYVRLFGIMGAIIMWFSITSLFILAAIGLTCAISLCFHSLGKYTLTGTSKTFQTAENSFPKNARSCDDRREEFSCKRWEDLKHWLVMCAYWAVSFYGLYKICLAGRVGNKILTDMWVRFFAPHSLWSTETVQWLGSVTIGAFRNPMGLSFPIFAAFVFICGCLSFLRRDKIRFCLLILPMVLTLLASVLHIYPFGNRSILFLIPAGIIFIAEGSKFLMGKRVPWLVGIIILGLLFYNPIKTSIYYLLHGRHDTMNRQAMTYLKENYRPGDLMFMNNSAKFAFLYYGEKFHFNERIPKEEVMNKGIRLNGYEVSVFYDKLYVFQGQKKSDIITIMYAWDEKGRLRWLARKDDFYMEVINEESVISDLTGSRVWIFFSHIKPDTKSFMLKLFDRSGERIDSLEFEGAMTGLYLYKMD